MSYLPTISTVFGSTGGLPDQSVGNILGAGMGSLVGGIIGARGGSGGAVAYALPAMSSANGILLNNTFAYYNKATTIAFPSGDWSLGGWFNCPISASDGQTGSVIGFGTYNAGTNTLGISYDKQTGRLIVYGRDNAGTGLGSQGSAWSSVQFVLQPEYVIKAGDDVHIAVVKSGNYIQLWYTFNGHAPMKVAEEYTTFGATGLMNCTFGGNGHTKGFFKSRDWFRLSYALTKSNIQSIVNGADPTTLGTPAADDFYIRQDTAGTTWTSTINSIIFNRFLSTGYTSVTGIGYAPQTNAVYLNPLGGDGTVIQQVGGSATVNLSGTYEGADHPIEIQFIDDAGVAFVGWTTIDASPTGGAWSGNVVLPKGKRWIRAQLRKVISGVASTDVMTTSINWGVGEIVMLSGQSLMQHMSTTASAFATTGLTSNGYVSIQSNLKTITSGVGYDYLTISGANASGGEVELTTTAKHGRVTGDTVAVTGIVGTTEVNNQFFTVTVTSPTKFILNGSTFTNAYVSGGLAFVGRTQTIVPNQALMTIPDHLVTIGNTISNEYGCVVVLSNQAVGGTPIAFFSSWSGSASYGVVAALHARRMGRVGTFLWLHGHANIGVTSYFSDAGSAGAWTGWGNLGTLYDFNVANFPNSDFRFGLAAFTAVGGQTVGSASVMHEFRWGMRDWVTRKKAAGNDNIFFSGWYHDLQPQWENGTASPNAHLSPGLKGYRSMAARLGHATAKKLLSQESLIVGPSITSATRSGAIIDLTVTHNGGSLLKVLRTGATASGFEVATDTGFTTKKTISDVQIIGANTIRITLSADPAATCYVRYQYGQVGDYATSTYITPRITGVADNGAGLIRVTCGTSGLTPAGSQKGGTGHGLTTGQWVGIEGVKGSTQANGIWQVVVIDATNFDLVGSSSVGLGAFVSGSNLWQSSATGVVAVEIGVPIYDDRTIGTYDTNGMPLQPTYTYLTAA